MNAPHVRCGRCQARISADNPAAVVLGSADGTPAGTVLDYRGEPLLCRSCAGNLTVADFDTFCAECGESFTPENPSTAPVKLGRIALTNRTALWRYTISGSTCASCTAAAEVANASRFKRYEDAV